MSEQQTEIAGDYGYDLVHEAVRAQKRPAHRRLARPLTTVPAQRTSDRQQDYAYDQAHDF